MGSKVAMNSDHPSIGGETTAIIHSVKMLRCIEPMSLGRVVLTVPQKRNSTIEKLREMYSAS